MRNPLGTCRPAEKDLAFSDAVRKRVLQASKR